MIIAVGSVKGSPGATTLATLLVWAWPNNDMVRLVVEADPDGGVLAPRWHLSDGIGWEPGLVELSTLRTLDSAALIRTSQQLSNGVRVVPAPPNRDHLSAAITGIGERGIDALAAARDVVAIVDVGRVHAGSPALGFARRAALTLLVVHPTLEQTQLLGPLGEQLEQLGCLNVSIVGRGDTPHLPAEIADEMGFAASFTMANDSRSAALLDSQGLSWRGLRRSQLGRSSRNIAEVISRWTESLNPSQPTPLGTSGGRSGTAAPAARQPAALSLVDIIPGWPVSPGASNGTSNGHRSTGFDS